MENGDLGENNSVLKDMCLKIRGCEIEGLLYIL